jgi:uncharacterized membrane protein SpoIIM required for sporulation
VAEPVTRFVARRRPDWEELRALLALQRQGALSLAQVRRLDALHRLTAVDLARAQSLYPGSDALAYLNQLAAEAHTRIYQPPRDRLRAVLRFYREELPATARANARFLAASAALFVLGIAAGALAIFFEPSAAELLVPAHLRDLIARKQMWTDDLLALTPPTAVSSAIAANNLTVTIAVFAGGILLGIWTVVLLLFNGLHLGSIAALCVREGMALPLFDFVAAHGPVELSIIVIAGGAGLMLGGSLIDPGELPRAQALRVRGVEAVKLVAGCAPFLLLIGFVEGYVSPGDLFPGWAKGAVGLSLGALLWSYLLLIGKEASRRTAVPEGSAPAGRPSRWRKMRS